MSVYSLWLPILLSGVVVFFSSFIAWTMLPHHKADFDKVPDEDAVMKAVGGLNLPPGKYLFPHGEHGKHRDPAFIAKCIGGPRGILTIWAMPNMGVNMILTFLVFLVASFFIAYLASIAIPHRNAPFMEVFQFVGTAGILAYCFAFLPNSIWFKNGKMATINCIIDGVVFGLLTGVVFGFLWPK